MPLLFLIIPIALLVLLAAGYRFYRIAFFPKVFPAMETLKMELDGERLLNYPEIETWVREVIHIHSPYGYELFGYFYPVKDSQKTVIISHGITISLYGSLKYAPVFRQHGFNVLVYDNRFHGHSGGRACTFGYYEKFDLKAVVDWVIDRFGSDAVIGTHGESLGAAITLQHAAIDSRIAFAISDCPFSDLDQLFRLRLREDYHLPIFPLLPLCGWIARQLLNFNYKEVSPIQKIGAVETPVLFIHGDHDTYIPPSMSVDMHRRKIRGVRAIYLAKNAKHAEALVVDREMYQARVDEFLSSIGQIAAVAESRYLV